jgi:hypothetical protein
MRPFATVLHHLRRNGIGHVRKDQDFRTLDAAVPSKNCGRATKASRHDDGDRHAAAFHARFGGPTVERHVLPSCDIEVSTRRSPFRAKSGDELLRVVATVFVDDGHAEFERSGCSGRGRPVAKIEKNRIGKRNVRAWATRSRFRFNQSDPQHGANLRAAPFRSTK